MNILVTLDRGYIQPLTVMLKSLLTADRKNTFDVYVMNSALEDEDFDRIESTVNCSRLILHDIKTDSSLLADAPVTDRYPKEMYYRIFAARFLPEHIDRILYLDPDLIVLKPLDSLYAMDMGDNFFAAASHVGRILTKVNSIPVVAATITAWADAFAAASLSPAPQALAIKDKKPTPQGLICKGGIYPPIHHDCGSFVVNGCGYEERSSILPVTVD